MALFNKQPEKQQAQPQETTNIEWFDDKRHRILFYGKAKEGKTFSLCAIIDEAHRLGKKVFYVSTDDGFTPTFKSYFGERAAEVAKCITYYRCLTSSDGAKASRDIVKKAQAGDWVFVDLISNFYEIAQDEYIDVIAPNGDPVEYIKNAAKDPAFIGGFTQDKWQIIKRINSVIITPLTRLCKAHVVGVCGIKDTEVEKAIHTKGGKKADTRMDKSFDKVLYRPSGLKLMSYDFETIVLISRDDDKRYFKVVGHRGKEFTNEEYFYEKDMWKELKKCL